MGVNCGRKGNDVAHLEEITLEKGVRSTVNKKFTTVKYKRKDLSLTPVKISYSHPKPNPRTTLNTVCVL